MRKLFLINCLFFFFLAISWQGFGQKISYQLQFPEPHTHYVEVKMQIEDIVAEFIDVKMPVWAPGSYLVRDFPKGVEGEQASDASGKTLSFEKTTKNTWRIKSASSKSIVFSYKVYAFEQSVRTSFIDESHASLNGTSIFMFVEGHKNAPIEVNITPNANWKEISTSLDMVNANKWQRKAVGDSQHEAYDILVDSPIEIGNHAVYTFDAQGVPHEIAIFGEGNFNATMLVEDVKRIVLEATEIFGKIPCKRYTFIVHNMPQGGGGLEHLNSTMLICARFGYVTNYSGFLSLVAHEYFHLWNVKRLRPKALGPFNYDAENFTRMLWVCEGFTSYYDDMIVYRAGFMDPTSYLSTMAGNIWGHENKPGKHVQSVAEASMDAWIKYYKGNENTQNSECSYYTKGSILAMLLDILILDATNGKKGLDEVMKSMYEEYYEKKQRGYTDEEFKKGLEQMAGRNFDEFYAKYVYGTAEIDYASVLKLAGIEMYVNNSKRLSLGISTKMDAGRLIVTGTLKGSPSYKFGLNVNDEILAIDGYRVTREDFLTSYISGKNKGETVTLLVSRADKIREIKLVLDLEKSASYSLVKMANLTEKQEKVYNSWLKIK